jgi:hypothetical protein
VRPFLRARSIAWLLATIAVGIIGENVAMLLFGSVDGTKAWLTEPAVIGAPLRAGQARDPLAPPHVQGYDPVIAVVSF